MADSNESVWKLEPGEVRKPGIAHVVALALFTGIGIVVGTFGSLAVPIGFVSAFWPGQAIQAVGSIWYGMWGGIAAFVFPLISNAMSGSAPLPGLAGLHPRQPHPGHRRRLDLPAARRSIPPSSRPRTGSGFTLVGILAANAIGALWGTLVLRWFGLITPDAHLVAWAGWFLGQQRGLLGAGRADAQVHLARWWSRPRPSARVTGRRSTASVVACRGEASHGLSPRRSPVRRSGRATWPAGARSGGGGKPRPTQVPSMRRTLLGVVPVTSPAVRAPPADATLHPRLPGDRLALHRRPGDQHRPGGG